MRSSLTTMLGAVVLTAAGGGAVLEGRRGPSAGAPPAPPDVLSGGPRWHDVVAVEQRSPSPLLAEASVVRRLGGVPIQLVTDAS